MKLWEKNFQILSNWKVYLKIEWQIYLDEWDCKALLCLLWHYNQYGRHIDLKKFEEIQNEFLENLKEFSEKYFKS
jgi:hypothetical protein